MLFRNNLLRFNRFMSGGGSRSQLRNPPPQQYGPSYPPVDPPVDPPQNSTLRVTVMASSSTVSQGAGINFTGSVSNAPAGVTLSYSWSFGDGATNIQGINGLMPSCVYTTLGEKTVRLTVSYTADGQTVEASGEVTITVTAAVQPPPMVEPSFGVDAGDPQTVSVGDSVQFNGSVSNAPAGATFTYSWAFGDGATNIQGINGLMPSCRYSTTGVKTVKLTVTSGGVSRSDTVAITVTSPPVQPVAEAGDNQTVLVNETVTFNGSGSTGNNLSYSWAFGADATPTTGSGDMPSCRYSTIGAKTVTLTVTDTVTKLKASDTVTITVHNAPIAEAGDNQDVSVGATVNFDGSDSTDPDGGELTYSWNLGTDATSAAGVTGATPSCIYNTTGAKTVTLTVTDDERVSRSDTVTITVHGLPVAEAGDNQTVEVDDTVTFDGSGSTGSNLTYSWDFGDGAMPTTGTGDMPSCSYSTTGAKTVTLTVTDIVGATASDTVTITVEPVAEAGSDQIVSVGETVTFDGSGSRGSDLSYSWDFGADAMPATGSGITPSCEYTVHGEKTVTLTITDGEGVSKSDTLTVTAVSIESKMVNDGESVDFEVLGAEGATAFSWGWETPSELGLNPDVGNSPAVVFSPTDSRETTIDNAKWYAYPNRACPTGTLDAASKSSVYTITCEMTFPGGMSFTADSTLTVNVPWVLAGFLQIGFSGSPTIAQSGGTQLWEVTGKGTIQRIIRSQTRVPSSSQFYAKVQAHEQVHHNQVNTGLASSYYTVNDLWTNHLRNLAADNRADLEILIQWAVEDFILAENERIRSLLPQLKRAAYQVSDPISPQYVYQRCGRFPE